MSPTSCQLLYPASFCSTNITKSKKKVKVSLKVERIHVFFHIKEEHVLNRIVLVSLILPAAVGLLLGGCGKKEEAAEKLHIVVATDAAWPPMEMVDENNEIVGFGVDLMKAAARADGFSVEFRNIAWEGIWAGLEAGEYDAIMSSVNISEERQKTVDFSMPYINAGQPGVADIHEGNQSWIFRLCLGVIGGARRAADKGAGRPGGCLFGIAAELGENERVPCSVG